MSDKTIYLMRHGETDMNRRECLQGQIDSELNETGIAEAEKAAELLRRSGIRFDAIWSSPLKRAMRTAEIVADGADVRSEPLITEMSFGRYEGMPYKDIDEGMWAFIHDPENVPPPEGVESIRSITGRVGEFLRRLTETECGSNFLVVAHGIALRAMLRVLNGSGGAGVWGMPIENCIIYKVSVHDGKVTDISKAEELSLTSDSDTSGVF